MDLSGDKSRLDFFMRKRQKTTHGSTDDSLLAQQPVKAEGGSDVLIIETQASPEQADRTWTQDGTDCFDEALSPQVKYEDEAQLSPIAGSHADDGGHYDQEPSVDRAICTPQAMQRSGSDESDKTCSPIELQPGRQSQHCHLDQGVEAVPSEPSPLIDISTSAAEGGAILPLCLKDDHLDFRDQVICPADAAQGDKRNPKGSGFCRRQLQMDAVPEARSTRPPQSSEHQHVPTITPPPPIKSVDADCAVDLEAVSIEEQQRILQLIEIERLSHAKQISSSFARRRQASIACFFRK